MEGESDVLTKLTTVPLPIRFAGLVERRAEVVRPPYDEFLQMRPDCGDGNDASASTSTGGSEGDWG